MKVGGEEVSTVETERRIREWVSKAPGNAVTSRDVRQWLLQEGASWPAACEAQNRLCQWLRKRGVIRLQSRDRGRFWVAA